MQCIRCKAEVPDGNFCNVCGASQNPQKKSKRRRGNNSGSAIRRGSSWTAIVSTGSYITFDENNIPHRHRKRKWVSGFETKTAALAYASSAALEKEKTVCPTLAQLWERYEKGALTKLSSDKIGAYKKARERLEPIITYKIDELTVEKMQRCIDEHCSSYYPAKDMKSVLSHLYKLAMQDDFVNQNKSSYLELPALDASETKAFSKEQISKMWECFSNGNVFLGYPLLMIYTGMMPGELFVCKKSMIDWDNNEIVGCGKKTKKRKTSPIVFPDIIRPVLEQLCDSVEGDLLWPKHKTEFYDQYMATMSSIGIQGMPPYTCRHTTATEAARNGISTALIQQIMRHSRASTQERYIHLASAESHAAINELANSTIKSDAS